MQSNSLGTWQSERQNRLEEIVELRNKAVGKSQGRKWGVRELNKLLLAKIAAEFQAFCRDLYAEATDLLIADSPPALQRALEASMRSNLALDKGNAHAGTLGSDFGRFGFKFIEEVRGQRNRSPFYLWRLEKLNTLRNAIAHEDENALRNAEIWLATKPVQKSGSPKKTYPNLSQLPKSLPAHKAFTLTDVRHLLRDVNHLAKDIDAVMLRQLAVLSDGRISKW